MATVWLIHNLGVGYGFSFCVPWFHKRTFDKTGKIATYNELGEVNWILSKNSQINYESSKTTWTTRKQNKHEETIDTW